MRHKYGVALLRIIVAGQHHTWWKCSLQSGSVLRRHFDHGSASFKHTVQPWHIHFEGSCGAAGDNAGWFEYHIERADSNHRYWRDFLQRGFAGEPDGG